MYEDMSDKKSSTAWSGQSNSKSSSSETKKNQDASGGGKLFPKSGRKREPPNYNARADQNRRPQSQKSKGFDKRPKPRGLDGYNSGRKENCQVGDDDFESDFGFLLDNFGSKKRNLNHLLNFHYEPRGQQGTRGPGSGIGGQDSGHRAGRQSLIATQAHAYNKEQFLQANCQFVVREGEDYSLNLKDPDLLVDWDRVELIITSSCERVVCPICLYPPVAAKITRCGHVYCWPCLLHYLALSDKSWRKCPICYESIHKQDLKSFEWVEKSDYSLGGEIQLRLMKRERGSLTACPLADYSARQEAGLPILYYRGEPAALETVYSKLLISSRQSVLDIISREYSELEGLTRELVGCPELCFVEQALELLATRRSLIQTSQLSETNVMENKTTHIEETSSTHDSASAPTDKGTEQLTNSSPAESNPAECPTPCLSEDIEKNNGETPENISAEDLEIKSTSSAQKYFYFYQAADGQQIYLHSLNVRMLEMTYGSLEGSPLEITGRILEKESGSMSPQLRKRLRYLQHVPITCQFEVVELDLKPPIISEETALHFRDQVEERFRRRARAARAEKRRERRIEEAEKREYLRKPAPNLPLQSFFHFPQCGTDEPANNNLSSEESGGGVGGDESEDRGGREGGGNIFGGSGNGDQLSVCSSRSVSPPPTTAGSGGGGHVPHNSVTTRSCPLSAAVAALSLDSDQSSNPAYGGPSFAQALREGKSLVGSELWWPSIGGGGGAGSGGGQASSSKATGGSGGAWNTSGTSRRNRQPSVRGEEEGGPTGDSRDFEDLDFSPPAKPSFSIAEALQLAASLEREEMTHTTSGGSGGRKKKKKQQKILFSTAIPKAH